MLSHGGKALARGILLRLGGAGLLVLAHAALAALRQRALAGARLDGDALACLLAAGGFLSASLGCAGLFLGGHLFDRVERARRWHAYRDGG